MLSAYLAATAFARPTFNVRDYGAVGDNATDDTGAFEKAIAAAGGGGQLLVPAGGIFLIRPLNLSSSLEFYIQGGATVAGIADHTKWPVIEAAPSYGRATAHRRVAVRGRRGPRGERERDAVAAVRRVQGRLASCLVVTTHRE